MSKDWTGNKKSTWAMLGASNHSDEERADNDLYCTDSLALDLLAPAFHINHKVWEPSGGLGHLSNWLKDHGHDVLATDYVERNINGITGGIDFLHVGVKDLFGYGKGTDLLKEWFAKDNPNLSKPFDILTNPPYNISTSYVLHALDLIPEDGHVIMFLKTSFLEGMERRRKIFDVNPPILVYQFSGRMVCAKNGDFAAMKNIGSAIPYSWIIWSKHNKEMRTELKWL